MRELESGDQSPEEEPPESDNPGFHEEEPPETEGSRKSWWRRIFGG